MCAMAAAEPLRAASAAGCSTSARVRARAPARGPFRAAAPAGGRARTALRVQAQAGED